MFGNAPKALWQRWASPDELNRIPLATRALLVQQSSGPKNVLLETGIGAFFDPDTKERFGIVEGEHVLLESLEAEAGLSHADIDVVVLSHLHFDHAGGLFPAWCPTNHPSPHTLLFPNATFVVSKGALDRARSPVARDRASFIPILPSLLQESGRLVVVNESDHELFADVLGPQWSFHTSHGHTPGMMLTELETSKGPLVFVADVAPGVPWVHTAITMGYDRYPELLCQEKEALFADLHSRGARLFFTHDPDTAVATLARTDKGRYTVSDPTAVLSESA